MDLERLIPDKSAQARLVLASGGTVRDLIDFTRQATLVAKGKSVITCEDVEYIAVKERSGLRDQIDLSGYWPAIGKLAAAKRLIDDPHCNDLLFYRLAFHYNGENWYDIHPLIAELPDFETTLKMAQKEMGKMTV
mgnify:CR=1 FL=1